MECDDSLRYMGLIKPSAVFVVGVGCGGGRRKEGEKKEGTKAKKVTHSFVSSHKDKTKRKVAYFF